MHRLKAHELLGMDNIPAILCNAKEEDDITLIEIDENLLRNELSPSEFDGHIALKYEIYNKRLNHSARNSANLAEFRAETYQEKKRI